MTAKANMTWLTDDLATGGDLSYDITKAHAQAQDIIEQGVTHIIDLRVESSDFDTWDGTEIQYHWLPTNDAVGHHLPQELFDAAVQIDRVARATGGKVLAHCHMGINRGPSVAWTRSRRSTSSGGYGRRRGSTTPWMRSSHTATVVCERVSYLRSTRANRTGCTSTSGAR
jgi:hypothetical protein